MKKFLALVLCLTLILTCFTALLGCGKPRFKTYTHGDWVIMHSAEGECLIYDLSEEGKQKEVLIFPTEVAGRKVTGSYYENGGWFSGGYQITSEKITRLYFTTDVELCDHAISSWGGVLKNFVIFDFEGPLNDYLAEKNFYVKKGMYCGAWGYFDWYANVSYYYNYENAPFDGFYWLDDYGDFNDEIIKYPPADPTRDGYEFAGWYKEPECLNKWNFETDLVPKKIYNPYFSRENYVYVETALYAKWSKI